MYALFVRSRRTHYAFFAIILGRFVLEYATRLHLDVISLPISFGRRL
jgi:hypothetical protein